MTAPEGAAAQPARRAAPPEKTVPSAVQRATGRPLTDLNSVPPEVLEAVETRRQKAADHWGQWVATGPIQVWGALAFNAGQAVPAGHVDRHPEWVEQGLVARTNAGTTETGKAES